MNTGMNTLCSGILRELGFVQEDTHCINLITTHYQARQSLSVLRQLMSLPRKRRSHTLTSVAMKNLTVITLPWLPKFTYVYTHHSTQLVLNDHIAAHIVCTRRAETKCGHETCPKHFRRVSNPSTSQPKHAAFCISVFRCRTDT